MTSNENNIFKLNFELNLKCFYSRQQSMGWEGDSAQYHTDYPIAGT